MGCDRCLEQFLLLPSIARRPTKVLLAAFRRPRSGAQTAEAPEIAKVAQRALQALCGLVHLAEFTPVAYRHDIRQRFQHVAEPFRLDPQTVRTRSGDGREMGSLADKPLAPGIEPMRAVDLQGGGGLATGGPLPSEEPWSGPYQA